MQLPNNNSRLPITSTKLNFYLAQCKSNQRKPSRLLNVNVNGKNKRNSKQVRQKNMYALNNSCNQYKIDLQNIKNRRENKQNKAVINKDKFQNIWGNQSFISVNACQEPTQVSLNKYVRRPIPYGSDALDNLITDRQYHDELQVKVNQRQTDRAIYNNPKSVHFNQIQLDSFSPKKVNLIQSIQRNIPMSSYDQFKNNKSEIYSSPNGQRQNYSYTGINPDDRIAQSSRQNVVFFKHHNNNQNLQRPKRRPNIKGEQPKIEKKSIYYLKVDPQFKQISNQLSRLTYQLNSNSKKLEEMNRVYSSIKQPVKVSPKQTIKRANLKYASVDGAEANQGYGLNHKPCVQYEDRIYKDSRLLMWQPSHMANAGIKHI